MTEFNPVPGKMLKSLRLARAWSLSQAAQETGVSKAMLGQIEREESSPTVALLWKIATGFNVPFSYFLVGGPDGDPAVLRSREKPLFGQHNAAMQVSSLFPFDSQLGFDMLQVELAAGALSESSPHESGVIEHVVVIEGKLQLAIGSEWHTLRAGEGLRFQADCAHSYRNQEEVSVKFHSLIHYPPNPHIHA